MSFRKRSEVIGGAPTPGARAPITNPRGPAAPRGAGITRGPVTPPPIGRAVPPRGAGVAKAIVNPSVRPSLATSQPTVSTGSGDLDKLLRHQGLPLGSSLAVLESGTTDFSSVLLRAFVAQGVKHNRLDVKAINCHCIVVGLNHQWASDLPGLYKGSKKDQKRQQVLANESKVSVTNANMKIAWRYGINQPKTESISTDDDTSASAYEHYRHTFDLSEKMLPAPSPADISYIPLGPSTSVIRSIKQVIQRKLTENPNVVIRVVVPSLLNPSIYSPQWSQLTYVVPFVHGIRELTRAFSNNVVAMMSLPLDLYQDTSIPRIMTSLADGVIRLEPFAHEMAQLIERVHKSEPQRVTHGLVHIDKVPVLSERGEMLVQQSEYAFKNGRKRFEIESWGIPVDEEEAEDNKQTTKDIEF